MTTVYDVPASQVIKAVAEELKKLESVKPPEWAGFVKTGGNKEKQPEKEDWWYVRSASILRKVRLYGPIGTPALRREYGGKKNRGFKPEAVRRGSGAVIRNVLLQLEKSGLVKKTKEGRVATPMGVSILDKTAAVIKRKSGENGRRYRRADEKEAAGIPAEAAS